MSALLLKYPKKPHQLSDDLESFVHLINWLTIRYHMHWQIPSQLGQHVYQVYEWADRTADGFDIGGYAKYNNMRDGSLGFSTTDDVLVVSPALENLMMELSEMCKEHYSTLDMKYLKRYAAAAAPAPSRPKQKGIMTDLVTVADMIRRGPSKRARGKLPPPKGEPLLDDHSAIMDILCSSLTEDDWSEGGEKLPDQFARIPRFEEGLASADDSTKVGSSATKSAEAMSGEANAI